MEYLSLQGETITEKVVEKSKFITFSAHIQGEAQAKSFIGEIKRKHPNATHCCYGFVPDKTGAAPRFFDDGEPQGTAGKPILDVLLSKKIFESIIVVVRYFGGIKLGAGGLTRAYSSCAAENISMSKTVNYSLASKKIYLSDYSYESALNRYFAARGIRVLSRDYSNEVHFLVAVKRDDEEKVDAEIKNLVGGKIKIDKEGEEYLPL